MADSTVWNPTMKQIRIETEPVKTERGPVRDFETAVKAEHKHLSLNTLYWFKQTAVRFYVRAGKIGADFYKPHKWGFSITRITTSGKREHKGWVEAAELLRQ